MFKRRKYTKANANGDVSQMKQGLYDGIYTFLQRCQCGKVMREGSESENQSLQPRESK